MLRSIAFSVTAGFLNNLFATEALAFPSEETASVLPLMAAFVVTIIAGLIIALILVNIARENSKLKKGIEGKKNVAQGVLDSEILRELRNLSGSDEQRKVAAMIISNLVNERMEEQVSAATTEIAEKYNKIVEEKSQEVMLTLQKYKQTLSEKKQTEAIVRSIADGLVVVNNKGEVLLMNPAAEKLLNTRKEDKIGRSLMEGAKDEQLFSFARASAEKEEKDIEVTSTDDETKKILRSSSAVIEDEHGKTVGMVTVLSDVTKQKELDRMKSDFVSSVSHELRNPLGAIQQSLAVILDQTAGPLTEHQERFLTNAQNNLKRLGVLIDDLLDLAKYEARKMELQHQSSSIEKIINEVCETLDTWLKNKLIKVERNVPADLPPVNVDPNRIIQVLMNIMGNAIKFTPNNGIITVSARVSNTPKMMEVSIQDTGVGIPKEDLPKIFDKFQQVAKNKSVYKGGTGLGLAIAREIVQLHGGTIFAESEEGQGAKFVFTVPIC